jgi:hypothetical protein
MPRTTGFESNASKLGFVFELSFNKEGGALFDDVKARGNEGAETTVPLLGDTSLRPKEEGTSGSTALRESAVEGRKATFSFRRAATSLVRTRVSTGTDSNPETTSYT